MVVKDRTQRYLDLINTRRSPDNVPATSSNGYYMQHRRSLSRSKSPEIKISNNTNTNQGVMIQRLSRQAMQKLQATCIVDDESIISDQDWEKISTMKESEKFRALSRVLAGKRPEHHLDGHDIPSPPDVGLHSSDFAVDREPSKMSTAQRHRSVSPYGDIDTFSGKYCIFFNCFKNIYSVKQKFCVFQKMRCG